MQACFYCKKDSGFNSKMINLFTTFVEYLVNHYPTKLRFNGLDFNRTHWENPIDAFAIYLKLPNTR